MPLQLANPAVHEPLVRLNRGHNPDVWTILEEITSLYKRLHIARTDTPARVLAQGLCPMGPRRVYFAMKSTDGGRNRHLPWLHDHVDSLPITPQKRTRGDVGDTLDELMLKLNEQLTAWIEGGCPPGDPFSVPTTSSLGNQYRDLVDQVRGLGAEHRPQFVILHGRNFRRQYPHKLMLTPPEPDGVTPNADFPVVLELKLGDRPDRAIVPLLAEYALIAEHALGKNVDRAIFLWYDTESHQVRTRKFEITDGAVQAAQRNLTILRDLMVEQALLQSQNVGQTDLATRVGNLIKAVKTLKRQPFDAVVPVPARSPTDQERTVDCQSCEFKALCFGAGVA